LPHQRIWPGEEQCFGHETDLDGTPIQWRKLVKFVFIPGLMVITIIFSYIKMEAATTSVEIERWNNLLMITIIALGFCAIAEIAHIMRSRKIAREPRRMYD
jgi:hypothetical protein